MKRVGSDYHLLTGYGAGSAEVDVLKYIGGIPHNEYLRVLYEMGLIGLLLFVSLLIQLWRIARSGVMAAESNFHQAIAGMAIGIITIYAAGSMVDNMISKYKSMGLLLYMLIGYVLILKNSVSSLKSS
jgi:O-antigen ligase